MRLLAIRCAEDLLLQFFTEGQVTNSFQVHAGLPADCKLLAVRMIERDIVEFLFIEKEHMEDDTLPWLLPVELIECSEELGQDCG